MTEETQYAGAAVATAQRRLAYIDWMRGLACLLMFQTHCYDSWLTPAARSGSLYRYSQLLGTLPAPIFLFLCGVSFALVTERLWEKGRERDSIARQTIWRGAEIYALGFLFRVQEFALGYPKAPWTDLLRVDVLNILGIAMMLMGVLCWLATSQRLAVSRRTTIWSALVLTAVVAIITPVLYTHRLQFLPWPIESYFDGVHTFNVPQPWLFPIFPWIAFAFAGLAAGFFLFTDFARRAENRAFAVLGFAGLVGVVAAQLFDRAPLQLYEVYDYWHTSPQFFLLRCGVLLIIMAVAYAWCQWGWARNGYSPGHSAGKDFLAGVLGAHRICIRAFVDSAKEAMQHRKSDCGIAGDFCLHDVAFNFEDQLEAKECGSAARKVRGDSERKRSSLARLLLNGR